MMIKTSDIPRVVIHKSWPSLFKQVSQNLEKMHKFTTDRLKAQMSKKG